MCSHNFSINIAQLDIDSLENSLQSWIIRPRTLEPATQCTLSTRSYFLIHSLINIRININPNQLLFILNTLVISTFSCSFEEFKNDVSTLFLIYMCKEFVTDYEFVKVSDHKSHLLMNCTSLEKLDAVIEDPFVT